MGKATGFLEYERVDRPCSAPLDRISGFYEFHSEPDWEIRHKQAGRCMNCGVPFCQSEFGCPLHNLIPEWNDEIWGGSMIQAVSRLLKTNNFPEFTGRVCPAMCENACICGMEDKKNAISVKDNELSIIEYAWANGMMKPEPPAVRTGKSAAVIGSGPAGLAAAEQLNKRGHSVTVYERDDRPGGLLMYGIPNMKLDKSVVERRIEKMKQEGIEFVTGVNVGSDILGESIMSEYDAVIICCGARKERTVETVDMNMKGVYFALDYLSESTKSNLEKRDSIISAKGLDVVVIGNGDTATDCVATAIRQGAASVKQLVRKPKPGTDLRVWPYKDMSLKTDYGQEEAAALFGSDPRMFSSSVKELISDEKGSLCNIIVNSAGEEKEIPAGMLLIAAGYSGAEDFTAQAFGMELNDKGRVGKKESHKCGIPGVFAAGDARMGATLVAQAIADGREAAREADEYLEEYTNL